MLVNLSGEGPFLSSKKRQTKTYHSYSQFRYEIGLEHRYYGESWPVKQTPNPSNYDLRYLTSAQSIADSAHFAETFRK